MTSAALLELHEQCILNDLTETDMIKDRKAFEDSLKRCLADSCYHMQKLDQNYAILYAYNAWYNGWADSESFDQSFSKGSPTACGIQDNNTLTLQHSGILWGMEMIEDAQNPMSMYHAEYHAMDRLPRDNLGATLASDLEKFDEQSLSVKYEHNYKVSRLDFLVFFYNTYQLEPSVQWTSTTSKMATCPTCGTPMHTTVLDTNASCKYCQIYYKIQDDGKWAKDIRSQNSYVGYM